MSRTELVDIYMVIDRITGEPVRLLPHHHAVGTWEECQQTIDVQTHLMAKRLIVVQLNAVTVVPASKEK